MHKVLVASCLAAAAFADAEPGFLGYGYGYGLGGVSTGIGLHPTGSVYESRSTQGLGKRSAEPGYLAYGYGYPLGGISTGVGLHPTGSVYESRSTQGLGKRSADAEPGFYTQNYWPSVVTPYGSSTCYGCRGKRSADPGYLGYGYGYPIGAISTGVGIHPTGSVYESRSAQGLGKRSAEPGYLGYGYGYPIGAVSTGVGLHPTGSVYESRSAQGLGKRSAEPGYLAYGYGYPLGGISTGVGLHPTGSVYESRSTQGLGKRSADAEPGYFTQNYWPSVVTPYGSSTCYGCRGKRSAEPGYLGYGYGHTIGAVSTGVGLHSTGSVYESRSAQGLSGRYLY